MPVRTRVRKVTGVTARLAGRLPWRKEMALAVLFIGTPFITGEMEYVVLNLVGLGMAALLVRRVTVSQTRAQEAAPRQTASPFPAAPAGSTAPSRLGGPRAGGGGAR